MKSDSLFTRYICSDEDSNPGAHTQNNLWSSLAMANFTKSHCEMMKQQYVKFKKKLVYQTFWSKTITWSYNFYVIAKKHFKERSLAMGLLKLFPGCTPRAT